MSKVVLAPEKNKEAIQPSTKKNEILTKLDLQKKDDKELNKIADQTTKQIEDLTKEINRCDDDFKDDRFHRSGAETSATHLVILDRIDELKDKRKQLWEYSALIDSILMDR